MALDLTLPATGVTKFGDLYAILRANFIGLYDLMTDVEDWTLIGSGGSSWGTNWASSNPAYPVGFLIDPMGFVHLQGCATNGGNTNYPLILPSGYWPQQQVTYMVGYNNSSVYMFAIYPDGTTFTGGGNGTVLFLDGITFKAAAV